MSLLLSLYKTDICLGQTYTCLFVILKYETTAASPTVLHTNSIRRMENFMVTCDIQPQRAVED